MDRYIQMIVENEVALKFVETLGLIVVLWLVSKIVRTLIYRLISDSAVHYTTKKRVSYLTGFIFVMGLIVIWIDSTENFTTYVGLLSAGIAIALKEVFTGIAGWIFNESRKLFDVGHRISIGNQTGDVIDKRLFQFSLMEISTQENGEQSTGRIIDVPNSYIFQYPLINYTKGFEFVWNEIQVLLTFESDWQSAKEHFLEILSRDTEKTTKKAKAQLKSATRKYMIYFNVLTPIVYTDVKESGIQLTMRYLCEPKKRRMTTHRIWEDILKYVDENPDVSFAYPTKRVVDK